jgi:hypothetical protein
MPRLRILLLPLIVAWVGIAAWNACKPLPPGTHVASVPARLAESEVAVIRGGADERAVLVRELAAVDRADELIVVDETPLSRELGQHLLLKRRERPGVKIVLVSDPRPESYGGTPAPYLESLERAGVIVARVRLERLRDPVPLYSGLWRLMLGWWSEPHDESPLRASLRARNSKADERALLVADDGAGGWTSIVTGGAERTVGVEVAGRLARDIALAEFQVAAWSTGDLPLGPRFEAHGIGSIDARYLTEGAIRAALLDALASAGNSDRVDLAARALSDRGTIDALVRCAGRGTRLQVLLDPEVPPNATVAAELERDGAGQIEIRWAAHTPPALAIVRRRGDLWAGVGGADLTRPSLGDFNLEAALELRLPASAGAARALEEEFAANWSTGAPYARYADASRTAFWRYRLLQATALAPY